MYHKCPSTFGWVGRLAYPYKGITCSNGKNEILIYANMGESQNMQNERSQRKKRVYVLDDAIYTKFWKMQLKLQCQNTDQ